MGPTILNCFLEDDEVLGACSTFVADQPGIALSPGLVHLNYHKESLASHYLPIIHNLCITTKTIETPQYVFYFSIQAIGVG